MPLPTSKIPQNKRLAMGEKVGFAKGGSVPKAPALPSSRPVLKTGRPDSPMEGVKRANGIVGMKKGGRA